jgi:hypothetical protein
MFRSQREQDFRNIRNFLNDIPFRYAAPLVQWLDQKEEKAQADKAKEQVTPEKQP